MLSVDYLAAHAVNLATPPHTPSEGADEALRRLAGRKTPVTGAREPNILWGYDSEAFATLRPALVDPSSPLIASVVPGAAHRLLTNPAAAYAQPAVDGRRAVSLVAAFVDENHEDPILAIGDLLLPGGGAGFELSICWVDTADRDLSCGQLAARYRNVAHAIGPRGPIRAAHRVSWVGGPGLDPADSSGWQEEIAAFAAARGYAAEVLARPAARVREIQNRLSSTDYGLVIVWACDMPTVAVASAIAGSARSPHEIIEEQRLADALVTAGWHLDEIVHPDDDEDDAGTVAAPSDGEVRYYRKRTSVAGGKADPLRRVGDCGKGAWQRTPKAIKALKGIEKLEGVSPKTLERCTGCLGGGHWRARF